MLVEDKVFHIGYYRSCGKGLKEVDKEGSVCGNGVSSPSTLGDMWSGPPCEYTVSTDTQGFIA